MNAKGYSGGNVMELFLAIMFGIWYLIAALFFGYVTKGGKK